METKVKSERYVAPSAQDETELTTQTEAQAMLPPASSNDEKWRQLGQDMGTQIATFLGQLPEYIGRFYKEYRAPIVSIGLIVVTIIGFKVLLAVIDALNDIPLMSPTFELIGISFTGWFVYRYLLKASTRQELAAQIQKLKAEFLGRSA